MEMKNNNTNRYHYKRLVKKGLVMLSYTIIILLVVALVAAISMRLFSSGEPEPFLDSDNNIVPTSISEKCFIQVNGTRQGMFISSMDSTNPVLLFIHGGPGMPEYVISRGYPLVLEKHFTVCWWEHRGAGISYDRNIPIETMNFDQFIEDAICVTNYLRNRFKQDKIYLMAHSGGTMTGIQLAAKAPELYIAYLAVAQISNQMESEKIAYKYMMEKLTEAGDSSMLRKFRKYSIDRLNTSSYYVMRDLPMHKLGLGTTHKMKSVISGVFLPVMRCKEYTFTEKLNVWRGKDFTTNKAGLWDKLVRTDLTIKVTDLKLPVYFFSGKYDYTVSYALSKDYFSKLSAPSKGFYSFNESAHSPMFEEPEKFNNIIEKDVLKGITNLSDPY